MPEPPASAPQAAASLFPIRMPAPETANPTQPAAAEPRSGADLIPSVLDLAVLDRTGVRNCSAEISAAHDAAHAAGHRYLFFPPGTYAAPDLSSCGNVFFVGPGVLTGAYHKHVFPLLQSTLPLQSGITPSLHLRHFLAAVASATPDRPAIVVGMGDSTTRLGSAVEWSESMTTYLQRRLDEQIPRAADLIRYVNRGIGAMTWAQASADRLPVSPGSWHPDPAKPWIEYVLDLAPDLIVLNLGVNDLGSFNLRHLRHLVARIEAASATRLAGGGRGIDIVFVTPFVPSLYAPRQFAYLSAREGQEGADFVAGYIRSFCHRYGYGLIDQHRASRLARDGVDPCQQPMTRVVTDQAGVTLPYTLPAEATDFGFEIVTTGGQAQDFWDRGSIEVTLSPAAGNVLLLERDKSGRMATTVFAGEGVVSRTRAVSDTGCYTGENVDLHVYVSGSRLTVTRGLWSVLDTTIERHGGLFRPTISRVPAGVSDAAFTIRQASIGQPTRSMPFATDAELFGTYTGGQIGSTLLPHGGNGINHLTSLGVRLVLGRALEATRFA